MVTKERATGYRGFKLDYEQGEKVFGSAVHARLKENYPYNKPSVQRKENWPEDMVWGSLKHALLLFVACIYQKGGIDSETSIKQITRVAKSYPHLFEPKFFLKLGVGGAAEFIPDLMQILSRFGLGSNANDAARCWVYNMQKLAMYWKGDPRLLFKGITKKVAAETWKFFPVAQDVYDELCVIIIRKPSMKHEKLMAERYGFYGFRHKMVSMLLYFYIDAGIIPRFAYPPPIDFHLIRFLCATQVIRFNVLEPRSFIYTERVLPAAREITLWYILKAQVSSEVFAEAMWVLSRELCKRTPGNKCTVDRVRKARARKIYEHSVDWTEGQVRRYDRTCGMCPVESECQWNIPSAYYYVKGGVMLSKRRLKPPQLNLIHPRDTLFIKSSNGHKTPLELPVIQANQLAMFE